MSTTINLVAADRDKRDFYGIILVSETEHRFTGRGIHNPHHSHVLQVWDTQGRATDPMGNLPTTRYYYLWAPRANVISAHPGANAPQGETLHLGDLVTLEVAGYEIGEFEIGAQPHHNPHLIQGA
jgi:hypothetical protein